MIAFVLALALLNAPHELRVDAPEVDPSRSVGVPRVAVAGLRNVSEFEFDISADYANPYDPDQIRIDAEVSGPGGRSWLVPAFWYEPVSRTIGPPFPDLSRVSKLRFFIASADFKAAARIEFSIDRIELANSHTGARRVLEDFEGDLRWQSGSAVTLAVSGDRPRSGAASLLVGVVNPADRNSWPGANLVLPDEDWSAFDTLSISWRPQRGLENASIWVEFVAAGRIVQTALPNDTPIYLEPRWRDVDWRFDRPSIPTSTWGAPGAGSWRVRLAVPESGAYTLRLRAATPEGQFFGDPAVFNLERGDPDGFVRVDSGTGNFFMFDSGRTYLPIGVNLVGAEAGRYDYYFPKFAAAGVNLARIWLSGQTLGIERGQPTEFDQQRAAELDGVVNLGAELGLRLMLCFSDYREARGGSGGYWDQTAYASLAPGPAEFFASPQAAAAYRKRLRYIVARWSSSTTVQSWEFFNEADLTSAWSTQAGEVRDWHRVMAEYLQSIDPYHHPTTSSFSGLADDALWAQPGMQIVQRHTYPGQLESLADHLDAAVTTLKAHGKPVLVGEFGTHVTNFYGDSDARGLGLHEGLWAPLFAGAAGSGMSWWWEWIDRYDLYPRFSAVSEFVRGLVWHEQGFAAVSPDDLSVTLDAPDAGLPPERVVLNPRAGSFAADPFNRPVTVRVSDDGTLEPPGLISQFVHSPVGHADLYNPQTYQVDYPAPGLFSICVGTVSGWGGAAMKITLDGRTALERRFDDPDGMSSTESLTAYSGCYSIDVPAGAHTVAVDNTGADWFKITVVTLTNYGRPRVGVKLVAARGRDTILVWARNSRSSWFAPVVGLAPAPARNVVASIENVTPGDYLVEIFDPQSGRWLGQRRQSSAGRLELILGEIAADLAVRCTKL